MENFIAILSLLIITGLFIVSFVFTAFLKSSSRVVDREEKTVVVVAHMIESLRKICPIGGRKGWTLATDGCSLPRCWKRRYIFPVFKTEILLYGSSLIVKSTASIIEDLISKPFYWDEWDASYFSSSMSLLENDLPSIMQDKYIRCVLVSKDETYSSQESASMYCFMNLSSDNVRWILFWNVMSFDWWFFLIQPALKKSDANHSLLTVIRGTDSVTVENEFAKSVWFRTTSIRDAAELHALKVYPFHPLFEQPLSSSSDLAEHTTDQDARRQRSRTESCSGELLRGETVSFKNSKVSLLQLVSSPGGEKISSRASRIFKVRLAEVDETCYTQENENSVLHPLQEVRCRRRKGRSLTATLNATVMSVGESKPVIPGISRKPQMNTSSRLRNKSLASDERSSSTNYEKSNSSSGRGESDIFTPEYFDLQNTSYVAKEHGSGKDKKRKKTFVEFVRKGSRTASTSSNLNLTADISKYVIVEKESYPTVTDEKVNILASDSSVAVIKSSAGETDTILFDSSARSVPPLCPTMSTEDSENVVANVGDSSLSSDKSANCKGNCSPICDVCLKAADVELSDYEVLLPHLGISEERIAGLVTKGNYCAAELQAEVHEASQVKTSANPERKHSEGRWTHISSNKDIDFFSKTKEERSLKIISYLCQGNFSISPNSVWDIIRNPRFRFICDETAKKVTVLEELPEQQKIIYTYHEFGGLLKKETVDFCLLHSERVEESKYSLAYSSIEYENCPLSAAVRGMLFPSGWVIEKLKESPFLCKLSYLTQVVVNRPDSLMVQESSNIALQYMQNLLNYCISAPESVRSSSSK